MKNHSKNIILPFLLLFITLLATLFYISTQKGNLDVEKSNTIPKYKLSPLNDADTLYDIDYFNDSIYSLRREGLFKTTDKMAPLELVHSASSPLDRIGISENYIALYHHLDKSIKIYDLKGNFIKNYDWDKQVFKLKFFKDKLFIASWQEINSHNTSKNITSIDLLEDKISILNMSLPIYTFDISLNEELIVIQEENDKLYMNLFHLDGTNLSSSVEIGDSSESYIEDILYTSNGIFMCGTNTLYFISNSSDHVEIIYSDIYNDFEGIPSKLIFDHSKLYVLSHSKLYTLDQKEVSPNTQLVLLLNDDLDNDFDISQFQFYTSKLRKNSDDITINFESLNNYDEKLSTKLYSKDSTFDLFITELSSLQKVYSKFCLPLEDDSKITATLDTMFSGNKEIVTIDKNLLAVPYNLSYEAFYINPNLKKHLITAQSLDTLSWPDFLDLCSKNAIDTDNNGSYDIWLSEWTYKKILLEIINQTITSTPPSSSTNIFDTPKFISLLETIKDLTLKGMLLEDTHTIDYNTSILLPTTYLSLNSVQSEGEFILPPVLEKQNPFYFMDGKALCINKNSLNQEFAKDLLEVSLQPENNIPYGGLPQYRALDWYQSYYEAFLQEYPGLPNKISEGSRLKMTQEILDQCAQIQTQSKVRQINHLSHSLDAVLETYIFDNLAIETTLDVINTEVIKMLN